MELHTKKSIALKMTLQATCKFGRELAGISNILGIHRLIFQLYIKTKNKEVITKPFHSFI